MRYILVLVQLFQIIRHYLKPILIIALLCAILGYAFSFFSQPQSFKSESSITAFDPSGNVSSANLLSIVDSAMQEEIAAVSSDYPEIKTSTKIDPSSASQKATLSVTAPSAKSSVEVANLITEASAAKTIETLESLEHLNKDGLADLSSLNDAEDVASILSGSLLQNVLGTNRTFKFCTISVNEATVATKSGIGQKYYALLGFVAGFLVALVFFLSMSVFKGTIRNRSDVEALTNVPILALQKSTDDSDRLWANIQFSVKKPLNSVCLIPLDKSTDAAYANSLQTVINRTGGEASIIKIDATDMPQAQPDNEKIIIYDCAPISCGSGAAYCSHVASITIILVRLWKDSSFELLDAIQEAELANADVIGLALIEHKIH